MTRRVLSAAVLVAALSAAAPAAQAAYCTGYDCPGVSAVCQFVGGCPPRIAKCYGSPEVRFCLP